MKILDPATPPSPPDLVRISITSIWSHELWNFGVSNTDHYEIKVMRAKNTFESVIAKHICKQRHIKSQSTPSCLDLKLSRCGQGVHAVLVLNNVLVGEHVTMRCVLRLLLISSYSSGRMINWWKNEFDGVTAADRQIDWSPQQYPARRTLVVPIIG